MIPRRRLEREVRAALARGPVTTILGPRQCGKTTLARRIAGRTAADVFDLESVEDRERLRSARLALDDLRGLVVIDEIQRMPGLFETLRVLADRPRRPATFLILGSVSPFLVRGVSESLAGRAAFVDMAGFDLAEVGARNFRRLWWRGGLPRSYLASTEARGAAWRGDFVRTFLERDVPQLGISIAADALRRFWGMVAHYHGQIWSGAEFARALGSSEPTARRYLDLLTSAFVVRQLPPWHENVGKRQVKSPKVYVRDSGLLHALLGLREPRALAATPRVGASWEGFALEQVLSLMRPPEAYFWATHAGAELDLMIPVGGRRYGFEFKMTGAPTMTKSMHVALEDLGLRRLLVVHPGRKSYRMERRVDAVAMEDLEAALP